jgi:hypothetical protein
MTTSEALLEIILARRDAVIGEARHFVDQWFPSSEDARRVFRNYAPSVRVKETSAGGQSVSIFWNRRRPVNMGKGTMMRQGRHGASKLTKVISEYIPPRKIGEAYPLAAFPDASDEEREDILVVEGSLAPLRRELKILGRLLLAVHSYARQIPPPPFEDDVVVPVRQDESLPMW